MKVKSFQKKANVRDVARKAGVSVATVSRVVNGSSSVSKETKARVESAIEALQFVRSSAARAINSGRSHLIGALVPTLDHAIFARFLDKLEEGLNSNGLSLIVATTAFDPEREFDRARKLLDLGVEGLIVSGISRAGGFEKLVSRHQVPVIATSYFQEDYVFPTIGYDNAAAASDALDFLLENGHENILVLSGPTLGNDRISARLNSLKERTETNLTFVETQLGFKSAGDVVDEVISHQSRPSAFLCLNDVMAHGVLIRLKAKGYHVPKDVSVVGIDDLPSSKSLDPPLTTIHLPVGQMGTYTAEAMARWIEFDERPMCECLKTRLVSRASVSPFKS